MAISNKTRKLLWGKAGNSCAMCKNELIVEGTPESDPTVVGQECHIRSEKLGGPRHDSRFPLKLIDSYDNLLLLCPTHHRIVDDQPDKYSVVMLIDTKRKHEEWVEKNNKSSKNQPVRILRTKDGTPEYLARLITGKEVLGIVGGAHGLVFDWDEPCTRSDMEELARFLQLVQDYGDLVDELEFGSRVEAAFEIGCQLEDLDAIGYWVFGARETKIVTGGELDPSKWYNAVLRLVRVDNPTIIRFDLDQKEKTRSSV